MKPFIDDNRIKLYINGFIKYKINLIYFYRNAPSIAQIAQTKDINDISKYYYHDDDSIHNLYLLFIDILNLMDSIHSQ